MAKLPRSKPAIVQESDPHALQLDYRPSDALKHAANLMIPALDKRDLVPRFTGAGTLAEPSNRGRRSAATVERDARLKLL